MFLLLSSWADLCPYTFIPILPTSAQISLCLRESQWQHARVWGFKGNNTWSFLLGTQGQMTLCAYSQVTPAKFCLWIWSDNTGFYVTGAWLLKPNTVRFRLTLCLSNAGDLSLIPGLGRSPGEGNGNPLQYFRPENPVDSPWGCRERDMTEQLTLSFFFHIERKDFTHTHTHTWNELCCKLGTYICVCVYVYFKTIFKVPSGFWFSLAWIN